MINLNLTVKNATQPLCAVCALSVRCLCVVCALSVRRLCAVCAPSVLRGADLKFAKRVRAPALRHDAPRTPRRPWFLGAGTPGRLRVSAACVLLASHRHDAPRMYAGALARLVRRGNSKNMGSRAASPTHERTSLWKNVNRTFCIEFWNLQVLPFGVLQ